MDLDVKYDWKDKKILIVEDDQNSSQLMNMLLKPTNAKVTTVYSGSEAVDFMKDDKGIDLILMDINLPDKDGLTATYEIKSINKDVVIIAQTAYVGVINKQQTERAGADDFLSKPIDITQFYTMLHKYFGGEA